MEENFLNFDLLFGLKKISIRIDKHIYGFWGIYPQEEMVLLGFFLHKIQLYNLSCFCILISIQFGFFALLWYNAFLSLWAAAQAKSQQHNRAQCNPSAIATRQCYPLLNLNKFNVFMKDLRLSGLQEMFFEREHSSNRKDGTKS